MININGAVYSLESASSTPLDRGKISSICSGWCKEDKTHNR